MNTPTPSERLLKNFRVVHHTLHKLYAECANEFGAGHSFTGEIQDFDMQFTSLVIDLERQFATRHTEQE